MKKIIRVSLMSMCVALSLGSITPIFAETIEYKENIRHSEKITTNQLTEGIIKEYNKIDELDCLKYTVQLDYLDNLDSVERKEYVKETMHKVINFLDGVTNVTPSVSVSFNSQNIHFYITKANILDENYERIMNNLVSIANTKKTDIEKIYVLTDYLYDNGYKYNYNYREEFPNINGGNIIESTSAMPNGVINTKKGVCSGYSNIMTDFCRRVGIPCVKIRGYMNQELSGFHVCNSIYLNKDGKYDWYFVDTLYGLHKKRNQSMILSESEYVKKNKYKYDREEYLKIINLKYSEADLKRYREKGLLVKGYNYSDKFIVRINENKYYIGNTVEDVFDKISKILK